MGTLETAGDLKRCFFQELYELDVSDDSVNDVGTVLAAFRAPKPKPKARPLPQAYNRSRAQLQHLGRTVSAPTPTGLTTTGTPKPLSTKPLSDAGDKHAEAVIKSPVAENFQSKTVADQKPTQMAPGAKGKRKRGRSLEVLPEAQQIFRGLRFCKLSIPFTYIILILERLST